MRVPVADASGSLVRESAGGGLPYVGTLMLVHSGDFMHPTNGTPQTAQPPFFWILAHSSFKVTVRLKTSFSLVVSGSRQK